MSDKSKIEWTDATWNPVRGCTKISPGCKNCYAERFAERWRGIKGHAYEHGFDLRLVPEKLTEPLGWKAPRRVFVNSMSDLFQMGVPFDYVDRVFATIALADRHTFQILTKRADRMLQYFANPAERRDQWFHALHDQRVFHGDARRSVLGSPSRAGIAEGIMKGWRSLQLKNVILGVSIENQRYCDARIDALVQLGQQGWRTMISVEPLLNRVVLPKSYLKLKERAWIVVGGESGPGARSIDRQWVRDLRDQATKAHVPFFFKQWGGVQKKKTGRTLDRRTWSQFPL